MAEVVIAMQDMLMFGNMMEVTGVCDDLQNHQLGYSLAKTGCDEYLIAHHVFQKSTLKLLALNCNTNNINNHNNNNNINHNSNNNTSSSNMTWNQTWAINYQRNANRILRQIFLLIHTCGGQPARSRELSTLKHTNDILGDRTMFLQQNGTIMFVTNYHKSQHITGKHMTIA